MYIVNSYTLAIIFCFITMICWGSWGNTQKLASKNWRYELYYWDYTIGILLFALLLVFTLGSREEVFWKTSNKWKRHILPVHLSEELFSMLPIFSFPPQYPLPEWQ